MSYETKVAPSSIDLDNEINTAAAYFRSVAASRGVEPTSRLYTVMDHGGGWRFVITLPEDIKHHVQQNERAIRVPRVKIAEPVEWDDIARTIKLAERYATKKLAKENPCGDCKACCTTLLIEHERLHKPAHSPCIHLDSCINGCGIHPVRPQVCKDYECEWLKSQKVNDRMPLELRPNNCGVIFQTATAANNYDPDVIEAHPDVRWPTNPFEAANVIEHIEALTKYGKRVIGITHYEGDIL